MYSWGSKLIDFESAFQVRNTCILGEINEIGLVQEFDKLENRYRTLNEETAEVGSTRVHRPEIPYVSPHGKRLWPRNPRS